VSLQFGICSCSTLFCHVVGHLSFVFCLCLILISFIGLTTSLCNFLWQGHSQEFVWGWVQNIPLFTMAEAVHTTVIGGEKEITQYLVISLDLWEPQRSAGFMIVGPSWPSVPLSTEQWGIRQEIVKNLMREDSHKKNFLEKFISNIIIEYVTCTEISNGRTEVREKCRDFTVECLETFWIFAVFLCYRK